MTAPGSAQIAPGPADGEGRVARETAQRVFAAEYNAANLEYKEAGERSPSYVVTPLGARVNRLFVVGVLTANERIGQAQDMWRAQIMDPTGTFNVYAGQYQPEAASALAEIRPPALVAVVGKSRAYAPESGVVYTSIRPETIKIVNVAERDRWVLETAKHTLARLDAMREAKKLDKPSVAALEELGYTKEIAEGTLRALEHYKGAELEKYAQSAKDALAALLGPGAKDVLATPAFATAASKAPTAAPKSAGAPPQPAAPAPAADARKLAVEEKVAALATKLDDGKGAPWEDIVSNAAKERISEEEVEEALNSLMDKGVVYEPVLGRIKAT